MKRVQNDRPNEFGDPKRDRMMRQVLEDAPGKAALFRKVYSGKASPRQAMKAFCLQCCWMDEAAIRECTATECQLWDFRPYQTAPRRQALSIPIGREGVLMPDKTGHPPCRDISQTGSSSAPPPAYGPGPMPRSVPNTPCSARCYWNPARCLNCSPIRGLMPICLKIRIVAPASLQRKKSVLPAAGWMSLRLPMHWPILDVQARDG